MSRNDYRIALRPDDYDDDPMSEDSLLDDIVVKDVPMFRAEQMDRNRWWVACYLNDEGDRIDWDVRARGNPLRIEWTTRAFPVGEVAYEHDAVPPTAAPCPATVTMHDDHWGANVGRCDLDAGHDGDHRSARTACEPVAYLGWAGTTDDERTT